MTARELIERLRQLPPDTEVWIMNDDMGAYYPLESAGIQMENVCRDKQFDTFWWKADGSQVAGQEFKTVCVLNA